MTLIAATHAPARAQDHKAEWNQVENVKSAAKRLGEMQRRQGSESVLKFLEACYKTHMLAEEFTEGLEGCMAQDYMHTQVLATVYSRLPPETIKKMGAPTPAQWEKWLKQHFPEAG